VATCRRNPNRRRPVRQHLAEDTNQVLDTPWLKQIPAVLMLDYFRNPAYGGCHYDATPSQRFEDGDRNPLCSARRIYARRKNDDVGLGKKLQLCGAAHRSKEDVWQRKGIRKPLQAVPFGAISSDDQPVGPHLCARVQESIDTLDRYKSPDKAKRRRVFRQRRNGAPGHFVGHSHWRDECLSLQHGGIAKPCNECTPEIVGDKM
jgi:hypothetical protein